MVYLMNLWSYKCTCNVGLFVNFVVSAVILQKVDGISEKWSWTWISRWVSTILYKIIINLRLAFLFTKVLVNKTLLYDISSYSSRVICSICKNRQSFYWSSSFALFLISFHNFCLIEVHIPLVPHRSEGLVYSDVQAGSLYLNHIPPLRYALSSNLWLYPNKAM